MTKMLPFILDDWKVLVGVCNEEVLCTAFELRPESSLFLIVGIATLDEAQALSWTDWCFWMNL